MKSLCFAMIASALSFSAHGGTDTIYHCYGKFGAATIAADYLQADSGQSYIQVRSGTNSRFFLVTDRDAAANLYFTGQEVDPKTGTQLTKQATLQVPEILMNKGSLQIDSQKISVDCESPAALGGTYAL